MKPARAAWLLAAFVLLAAAGCKKSKPEPKPGDIVEREGEPPVIHVGDDDPAMEKAIADARRTVDVFIERLASPKPDQVYFSVKAAFTDRGNTEHIWLSDVVFRDGAFHGKLGNNPEALSTPKLGDDVSVAKGEISDWMIIERGELRGGYSIRLLRSRMNDAERKKLDAEIGLTINNKIDPD